MKWTKEQCIEAALKYKSVTEWRLSEDKRTYFAARDHRWLSECCAHMNKIRGGYKPRWTLEQCKEQALQFKSVIEWCNGCSSFYTARAQGWVDLCTGHMTFKNNKPWHGIEWTKELCIEDAKKYSTVSAWRKDRRGVYSIAVDNGWLEECSAHFKDYHIWTFEACQVEAKKHPTRAGWRANCKHSYRAAKKKGWLDIIFPKRPDPTKEECLFEAKKYSAKACYYNASPYYNFVKNNGWLEEACAHMKIRNKWSLEKCKAEALKYSSRKEWRSNSASSYSIAVKRGWLKSCTAHMQATTKGSKKAA